MLNRVYRLASPRLFEPVETEIDLNQSEVIVRPTYLSICNADQRYYRGLRDPQVLAKKLPMALIHEGIGEVVADRTGGFRRGERVVMLPNAAVETDDVIGENYLRSSTFSGSGVDGFMQEYVALPASRVLRLPDSLDNEVAAFTEIVSVAVHAVTRFESLAHSRRQTIGVWGDGNLGFLVAAVLRAVLPNSRICIVGRNQYKLDEFSFADKTYLTYQVDGMPEVDHAFECCGGDGSAAAIDQIIDVIKPEGTISLLGVSENRVPINTRMVLEKGLRLFGSSRSGRGDFERVLDIYAGHPRLMAYLSTLSNEVLPVRSIEDIAAAFETGLRKSMGKTVMKWDI